MPDAGNRSKVIVMTFGVILTFLARLSLVLLFLPFSALDKLLNFDLARQQARSVVASAGWAKALILTGLAVEVFMSLGVLTEHRRSKPARQRGGA